MAQKHEDILSIDQFLGLNQSADNLRLSYAASGYNFSVRHGVLGSVGMPNECNTVSDFSPEYTFAPGEDGSVDPRNFVRTLGLISQRWKDGYSGAIPADTTWLITVLNGKIYARKSVRGTSYGFYGTDWIEIYDGAFQQDLFDCVTYEINYAPPEIFTNTILIDIVNKSDEYFMFDTKDGQYYRLEYYFEDDGSGESEGYARYINKSGEEVRAVVNESNVRKGYHYPVDALVMSNSKDGMYLVYCPPSGAGNATVLAVTPITIQPSGETHEMKFGCIARFAERIWGSGIETDPDKLVYSAPYDIFNWEQNNDMPEDGAGDIQQPDWDGDRFTALRAFGNQLVCFKKNSIWSITGSNPSAFYMRKQYGHGTIYEDSIAVHNGNVYFITDTGMHTYDSVNVNPLKYGYLSKMFDEFRSGNKRTAFGRMCSGKYYFVLLSSHSNSGSAFCCLDTLEGTISAYNFDKYPFSLIDINDKLYMLYTSDGKWRLAEFNSGGAAEMYYETAWQDFGAKNVTKSEFEVYLMPSVYMGDTVEMEIGIQTEYKRKAKTVVLSYDKVKRVKLNAKGRKFKFWMKAKAQNEPWKLVGGVQIAYSLDYD